MVTYWISFSDIQSGIYIPKFYDPTIVERLESLKEDYHLYRISELEKLGVIKVATGHEIGKQAYGTGDIPFVRTSDISNWEIKTAPKQGVSQGIYDDYSLVQDVQEGDILLVRDGTYLIGTNCFITRLDKKILYQSHILKIRIVDKSKIDPHVFFIALNSDIVQMQIRSKQFTADIIDTIGNRYKELIIPIIKADAVVKDLSSTTAKLLEQRVLGKTFVRAFPTLIEQSLKNNSLQPFNDFNKKNADELAELAQDTVRAEFGSFEAFWIKHDHIVNNIFLPKYYEPSISKELKNLKAHCDLLSMGELKAKKKVEYYTGDEIGKMAYGTGSIPFLRTSDFANWEVKFDPKQGISEEIYQEYADGQDVKKHDILLVRDGTYLVGSSCILMDNDTKSLFCGGLYKVRSLFPEELDPWLLFALMNSYIVKRQIRTKQFTRDVIDTIGNRLDEVILPIPKNKELKAEISRIISSIVHSRVIARDELKKMIQKYACTTES